MEIFISETRNIDIQQILTLYKANKWSSAEKPDMLHKALTNSHSLVTAWHKEQLVGLGNAISDGHLMVYFPHLLVLPEYHEKGVGKKIVNHLVKIYKEFHMQMLTADGESVAFYEKCGFTRAGNTVPMWIYEGDEH